MKTTAVVPVYNENPDKLNLFLDELKQYVDDIVIVDDGSTNNLQQTTYNKQQFTVVSRQSLVILRHEFNRGQGAALQTGTDYAMRNGANIIVHIDGDGQHKPENIPALIKPIQQGQADIVFGSKFLDKTNHIPWTKKHLIIPIARIINFLFSGLWLTDAHNGLRAFRAAVGDKLYLSHDHMAHATEYLQLVKKNRLRYIEVGVNVNYYCYGQNLDDGIKIVKELLTEKIFK